MEKILEHFSEAKNGVPTSTVWSNRPKLSMGCISKVITLIVKKIDRIINTTF